MEARSEIQKHEMVDFVLCSIAKPDSMASEHQGSWLNGGISRRQ